MYVFRTWMHGYILTLLSFPVTKVTNYFIFYLLFKLSTYVITEKPFTGLKSSILDHSIQLVNILNHEQDDKPKFGHYKEFAQSCIEEALGVSNPDRQDFFIAFRLFDQTFQNMCNGHGDVDMFDEEAQANKENLVDNVDNEGLKQKFRTRY